MRNWEISRSRTGKRLENVRPGDPNEVRVLLKRGASEMGVLTEDRFRMRKLHPGEPFPARGHTRSEGIQGILRHPDKAPRRQAAPDSRGQGGQFWCSITVQIGRIWRITHLIGRDAGADLNSSASRFTSRNWAIRLGGTSMPPPSSVRSKGRESVIPITAWSSRPRLWTEVIWEHIR